jgi:uncharacterized protein YceK
MHTTRSFFLGAAAGVLLAGCGSSSSSTTAATGMSSSSAAATASASQAAGASSTAALTCALAPSALVDSDLGVTGLGTPKQALSGGSASCIYSGGTNIVTISLLNGATSDKMSAEQQSLAKTETTATYAGLGDQAFTGTVSAGSGIPTPNTLVARQGSVEIMVVSEASVSNEKTLEEHIFAKVG